jgi:hypothetical protein
MSGTSRQGPNNGDSPTIHMVPSSSRHYCPVADPVLRHVNARRNAFEYHRASSRQESGSLEREWLIREQKNGSFVNRRMAHSLSKVWLIR